MYIGLSPILSIFSLMLLKSPPQKDQGGHSMGWNKQWHKSHANSTEGLLWMSYTQRMSTDFLPKNGCL